PMLVAAGTHALTIADGTPVVVDGDTGEFVVDPASEVLREYERRLSTRVRAQAVANAAAAQPAMTKDGMTIAISANIASVDDAKAAADAHADGAGLVRTEFLFQTRAEPPGTAEQ